MDFQKIISALDPHTWNEGVLNATDAVLNSKRSLFVKIAASIPLSVTGIVTSTADAATEALKLGVKAGVATAKYAVLGTIRTITWSNAFDPLYRALPSARSSYKTAKKVVAKTVGIFTSMVGLVAPKSNVNLQEKLGNFINKRKERIAEAAKQPEAPQTQKAEQKTPPPPPPKNTTPPKDEPKPNETTTPDTTGTPPPGDDAASDIEDEVSNHSGVSEQIEEAEETLDNEETTETVETEETPEATQTETGTSTEPAQLSTKQKVLVYGLALGALALTVVNTYYNPSTATTSLLSMPNLAGLAANATVITSATALNSTASAVGTIAANITNPLVSAATPLIANIASKAADMCPWNNATALATPLLQQAPDVLRDAASTIISQPVCTWNNASALATPLLEKTPVVIADAATQITQAASNSNLVEVAKAVKTAGEELIASPANAVAFPNVNLAPMCRWEDKVIIQQKIGNFIGLMRYGLPIAAFGVYKIGSALLCGTTGVCGL